MNIHTNTRQFMLKILNVEIITEEQPSIPIFVKELQSSFAMEGCSYKLECTVKGNPLPTVQWYKNDINIDNYPDYIITFNNGEAVLKFDEVFLEDKASYTCKAINQWGQSFTSAFLDVKRKSFSNNIGNDALKMYTFCLYT